MQRGAFADGLVRMRRCSGGAEGRGVGYRRRPCKAAGAGKSALRPCSGAVVAGRISKALQGRYGVAMRAKSTKSFAP